jgi:hypothetical protein
MADEPAPREAFGVPTGYHGTTRYPLARVATLCLAGTMTVQSYAPNDFVGWRTITKSYRRENPKLPRHLLLRFIQATVRIRGKRRVIWLVTSLLETQGYPAAEIVALYGRRGRIETLLAQLEIRRSAEVLPFLLAAPHVPVYFSPAPAYVGARYSRTDSAVGILFKFEKSIPRHSVARSRIHLSNGSRESAILWRKSLAPGPSTTVIT